MTSNTLKSKHLDADLRAEPTELRNDCAMHFTKKVFLFACAKPGSFDPGVQAALGVFQR